MNAPQEAPLSATALHLLVTAERLFAERGIEGVSLRQIVTAAGSANKSAVQYHFGSKDGLLHAIFSYRLADLLARRALLRARVPSDDLRGRFEAHVMPLLELAESPDCSYVSFVDQLQRSGAVGLFAVRADVVRAHGELVADLRRLLDHLPEPLRTTRIEQAQMLSLHVAADRERARHRGDEVVPFGVFVSGVVDGFTGFLAAPASVTTLRLAGDTRSGRPAAALRLL